MWGGKGWKWKNGKEDGRFHRVTLQLECQGLENSCVGNHILCLLLFILCLFEKRNFCVEITQVFTETLRPSPRHACAPCLGREIKTEIIKSREENHSMVLTHVWPFDKWVQTAALVPCLGLGWAWQCLCLHFGCLQPNLVLRSSSQWGSKINLLFAFQLYFFSCPQSAVCVDSHNHVKRGSFD